MSRIRSIKPELPQDERVGAVSREARLCWLLCFTLADDEGRFRAHPALIAGQCFPYDGLSPTVTDGWMDELGAAKLLYRYTVDGQEYAVIGNWTKHQKIDHPVASRLPSPESGVPRESSRILARVSEVVATDKDQDRDMDQEGISIVPNGTHSTVGRAGDVALVFASFRERHPQTQLTPPRSRLIAKWVGSHGVVTCVAATKGIVYSPHHQGDNDRGTVYDSLEVIFKNAANVEAFAGYELDPGTRPTGHPRGKVERDIRGQPMDAALAEYAFREVN